MTERTTTLVQARMSEREVRQLDDDAAVLGMDSRSEAVREGLRLLHRHARDAALARAYDEFYGDREAPISDTARVGHELTAKVIAERERGA